MIRFCDKEVFVIHKGELTRSQLISFFLKSDINRSSVIVYFDEKEKYEGMTTYKRVLANEDEDKYICKDILIIDDNFWINAKNFLKNKDSELYPVINNRGEILGFCWEDNKLPDIFARSLSELEDTDLSNIPFTLRDWNERIELICISDLNEWAWRSYLLFKKMGYPVCVIGEKWEWFGLKQMEGYMEYPEYAKLYIYAEGTGYFRGYEDDLYRINSDEIINAFNFFVDWLEKIQNKIYEEEIKRLSCLGVTMCKCIIPKLSEVEVITKDERKSILLKADIGDYLLFRGKYPKEKLDILISQFGEDVYKELLLNETDNDSRGWKMLLSNIGGDYLENENIAQKRIYIVGPCIVGGYGCLTKDTLVSRIQDLVSDEGYVVVRLGHSQVMLTKKILQELPIKKGDIILFVNTKDRLGKTKVDECKLKSIYNNESRKSWFSGGNPFHVNGIGSKEIAEYIYNEYLKDKIKQLNESSDKENIYLQKGEIVDYALRNEIRAYAQSIRDGSIGDEGKIGAIVMNCNPFTLGHQYLIEFASSLVDYLYVFVVEEDKSVFKFKDRFRMVKDGTKHIRNVRVVASGKWVLSYDTLPLYFGKSEHQEEEIDATLDLEIFARYIAPELNISCRFVGEEPHDRITRQYNEQMKNILGELGINVIEIKRKEYNNYPISASLVRKYINDGMYEQISEYVPNSTYQILRELGRI
ncbi:MAG: adenylyltransferase/cytidyltransferase family protein [Lachnospiraceae bacterium]|nr:adenylyltransferase/cytidyltransferase family protein [Lachnospiraceae bacterium]